MILAGIAITQLVGSGLISKAKEVKIQTEIASIKEEIQTDILGEQIKNKDNISNEILKEILEKYGELSEEEKLIDKTLTTKENYKIKVSDILNGTTVKDIPKEPVITDNSGANLPNLNKITQKTYVTWNLNESGTEYEINDTQTIQPDNWYDYDKGQWANIKTTNKVSDTENLEAYWVWIPRYEYIIPTSVTATQIEVKFISKNQTTPDKGYYIHPAFTNVGNGGFGELEGIWVAKFKAVSNTPTESDGGGNNSDLKVQVIPNKPNWRNIDTNNIFSVCRKMTKSEEVLAGSTVDSHMMKNIEWGAVAILSQSKYGVYNPESTNGEKGNKEYQIWNNSSSQYITGAVGTNKDANNTTVYVYNSVKGPKASTTGTVYGVYDMTGGSWEYVAGTLKGNSTDLEYANSKFNISNQVKPNGISDIDFTKKYLDLYDYRTSYTNNQYIIGDATVETNGWNEDNCNFILSSAPVFVRGRFLQHWHKCGGVCFWR